MLSPSSSSGAANSQRLPDLYPEAKRLVHTVQEELTQLEALAGARLGDADDLDAELGDAAFAPSPSASGGQQQSLSLLQERLRERLDELARKVTWCEGLVMREGAERRDMWRRRVRQLGEETGSLRASFELQSRRLGEHATREELMGGRMRKGRPTDAMGHAMRQSASLERSTRAVDELTGVSRDTLESMRAQRERLKAAQRKAWDVANLLGLSGSILRLAERREIGDKYIVYLGMVITTGILVALWYVFIHRGGVLVDENNNL